MFKLVKMSVSNVLFTRKFKCPIPHNRTFRLGVKCPIPVSFSLFRFKKKKILNMNRTFLVCLGHFPTSPLNEKLKKKDPPEDVCCREISIIGETSRGHLFFFNFLKLSYSQTSVSPIIEIFWGLLGSKCLYYSTQKFISYYWPRSI